MSLQAQAKALKNLKKRSQKQNKQFKPHINLAIGSPMQQLGHLAEINALNYLIAQDLKIISTNLRCKAGEIDILALDGNTVVFVEVRKRNNSNYGGAAASINKHKQLRIIRTANYFLPKIYRYLGKKSLCRFDVITIEKDQILWIKNAFTT